MNKKKDFQNNNISVREDITEKENSTLNIEQMNTSHHNILKTVEATCLVYYREGPSKDEPVIGCIEPKQKVEVEQEEKDWYKLKDYGWSMKQFYEEQA